MRTCYIFSGAPMQRLPSVQIPQDALILCADGGYAYAQQLGIVPDCILGDFDTLSALPTEIPVIRHPSHKDDTDTMLAVRYGLSQGCQAFVLYGSIGGRLDHTAANIQTLRYLWEQGATGWMVGDRDCVTLHAPGTQTYRARQGFFSVFALETPSRGVTLRGVKYPLTEATLTTSFPLGVSNEITAAEATVTLESGLLLLIFSAD